MQQYYHENNGHEITEIFSTRGFPYHGQLISKTKETGEKDKLYSSLCAIATENGILNQPIERTYMTTLYTLMWAV